MFLSPPQWVHMMASGTRLRLDGRSVLSMGSASYY
jgi:hypothetical protein